MSLLLNLTVWNQTLNNLLEMMSIGISKVEVRVIFTKWMVLVKTVFEIKGVPKALLIILMVLGRVHPITIGIY